MSEGVAAIAGLMDQPLRREEIPSVVCRFLAHAAHEAPVIVVIDDLQWADSDLLQLLRTVITSSQDVPLFVLCLGEARTARRASGLEWWRGQRHGGLPRTSLRR